MPTGFASSMTGTAPQSASRKIRTASSTVLKTEQVRGSGVITSAAVRLAEVVAGIGGDSWKADFGCGRLAARGVRCASLGPAARSGRLERVLVDLVLADLARDAPPRQPAELGATPHIAPALLE